MEEALLREIMEETGYTAKILRFAAISEEIYDDPRLREKYPDYCHRILHIFVAEALEQIQPPSDYDFQMRDRQWFSVAEADRLPVLPVQLRGRISEILSAPQPVFLGMVHTNDC